MGDFTGRVEYPQGILGYRLGQAQSGESCMQRGRHQRHERHRCHQDPPAGLQHVVLATLPYSTTKSAVEVMKTVLASISARRASSCSSTITSRVERQPRYRLRWRWTAMPTARQSNSPPGGWPRWTRASRASTPTSSTPCRRSASLASSTASYRWTAAAGAGAGQAVVRYRHAGGSRTHYAQLRRTRALHQPGGQSDAGRLHGAEDPLAQAPSSGTVCTPGAHPPAARLPQLPAERHAGDGVRRCLRHGPVGHPSSPVERRPAAGRGCRARPEKLPSAAARARRLYRQDLAWRQRNAGVCAPVFRWHPVAATT